MKFITAATTLLLFSILTTYGNTSGKIQNSETDAFSTQGTKAIAIAGIDSESRLNNRILDNLKDVILPGNYFQINLSDQQLTPPNLKITNPENISLQAENRLQNWLNKNKTGQNILEQ